MDWSQHYPDFIDRAQVKPTRSGLTDKLSPSPRLSQPVEIADIGCGFGGLLFALSPKLPQTLILGLEIRTSVTEFVTEKIKALRSQHNVTQQQQQQQQPPPGPYSNISCLRANTMKFLPNFFTQAQLAKIFLCFPDPHFKARKHKQRIVSQGLCAEYAFVLRPGGRVYTITDVEDLHLWMVERFQDHESFERVPEAEVEGDECACVMRNETEEGKKVERNGGKKFVAVFKRLEDPPWPS